MGIPSANFPYFSMLQIIVGISSAAILPTAELSAERVDECNQVQWRRTAIVHGHHL
jgi:hypothetical protein